MVTRVQIRFAEKRDLPSIVGIYNQAIEHERTADRVPWNPSDREEWFAGHDRTRYPIWVAEIGGRVVGWVGLSPYRPGREATRHTAEISFYVDYGFQRAGVASGMLEAALDGCPRLGLRTIFAIVLDDNAASVALLRRHDFEPWGHLPDVADFEGRRVGHDYYGRRILRGAAG